ncbi:30S ribosomal protein S8 [candidate division WOR-1 bacterium RIFOXYB2_FULL_48_7]|uniref:Small ribosomal subunit protein uS8 n=1 Tax=candidate division WOR-1 bacterium RIFOXYB2_FULL_48_7 TaxID=1802583 RepID=A0A1F4TPI9_UNCSA|nr:MAG: 30S ribosomal protein S8 [candidate division WOR-1 bacterium RIFOXYB2_FULL_48_7]
MDTIADMLVRMQNALRSRKESVDIPQSKMKEEIAKILLAEGYIAKIEPHAKMNKKSLRLVLKYGTKKKGVISGMKRISTPGRRIYIGSDDVPYVQSGFGTAIISTSKGLMTDSQARKGKIGGEVICYVW